MRIIYSLFMNWPQKMKMKAKSFTKSVYKQLSNKCLYIFYIKIIENKNDNNISQRQTTFQSKTQNFYFHRILFNVDIDIEGNLNSNRYGIHQQMIECTCISLTYRILYCLFHTKFTHVSLCDQENAFSDKRGTINYWPKSINYNINPNDLRILRNSSSRLWPAHAIK